eukprot:TRINITY_DN95585_c0_g1_i1.p1 TRINITY_DN95585_c0_g1~~TRINITY_DN95585_c0_g1_i1.p1  ORF type:complete len:138 (-),score=11.94 TRINITY_DN95585_c0_g1_i1:25-438(-)
MKFIYNHSWVLNALRKDFTGGSDLFRPGITRFAMNFISLQSLFMFKGELQKMFTSDLWVNSRYCTSPIGLDISDLLLDSSFWRNVEHILNLSEPLVRVLCFVDMKIGLPWAICTKQWIEQKRQSRRILIKDEEYEEK